MYVRVRPFLPGDAQGVGDGLDEELLADPTPAITVAPGE